MASGRILAHLHKKGKDKVPRIAAFTECVVDYFDGVNGQASVSTWLDNNNLVISTDVKDNAPQLNIKHPGFCPIKHMSTENVALSESTLSRGINTGVAIIMESSDGKILLTKRAPHLHTFPNIWVPPGGHLEQNESLTQAGLRELQEETGLTITEADCCMGQLEPLALWESVYPPRLALGAPSRHHIVLYLHAKLTSQLTADALFRQLRFDPGEVAACVWVNKKVVEAIVKVNEEVTEPVQCDPSLPRTLRGLLLNSEQKQVPADISLHPFLQRSKSDVDCERVSTGTKYALEQFLLKTK